MNLLEGGGSICGNLTFFAELGKWRSELHVVYEAAAAPLQVGTAFS